jgi:ABC-type microcin C transport system permease subunit YejE
MRREVPSHKSVRILGVVLGIPQGILGAILVSIGAVLPFVGMYDLAIHHLFGTKSGLPALYMFASVVTFVVGYHYLKESLWLVGIVDKKSTAGW